MDKKTESTLKSFNLDAQTGVVITRYPGALICGRIQQVDLSEAFITADGRLHVKRSNTMENQPENPKDYYAGPDRRRNREQIPRWKLWLLLAGITAAAFLPLVITLIWG